MGKDIAGCKAEKLFAGYAVLFQQGIIHIGIVLVGEDVVQRFFLVNGILPFLGSIEYAEEKAIQRLVEKCLEALLVILERYFCLLALGDVA